MKSEEQEWRRMSASDSQLQEDPFHSHTFRVSLHVPLAVTVELTPVRVLSFMLASWGLEQQLEASRSPPYFSPYGRKRERGVRLHSWQVLMTAYNS